jgi:hypothetical protein
MKTKTFIITSVLSILLFSQSIFALTPFQIMEKVDARDDGNSAISETVMVLMDKKNNKRVRKLKGYRKDFGKDSKNIIFFLTPADVKNTAFLTYDWDDEEKDDDTWLYLPALRKVKRISSSNKSGSFMGSDFTYSDMNGVQIEDWDYKFAKKDTEKVDGFDCWVIEGKPKLSKKDDVIKRTGYLKSKLWIRKDIYISVRGKFWVKKGKKIKYLTVSGINKIDNIWTAKSIKMVTTKQGKVEHSSLFITKEIQYNQTVSDTSFTTQRMERGL